MSGFSEAWLSLREPLDAASRDAALVDALVASLPKRPLTVTDLATGTGSNLRFLAPRLGGRQHWRLLDHDQALLDSIPARLGDWAAAVGATVGMQDDGTLLVEAATFACRIERLQTDLTRDLGSLDLPSHSLVTASALLDLVSAAWLDALAERCRRVAATALFVLSYDGRIELAPEDPLDAAVTELVNRHQRTDKGFGAALGPTAADYAAQAFAQRGYRIERALSDWQIDAHDRALHDALLADWCSAAKAVSPEDARSVEDWAGRRAKLADEDARLRVGHVDLLARLQAG